MVAQIDKNFSRIAGKRRIVRWVSYLFYEGRPLTTKGRWFNVFVFLLYRLQSLLPESKKIKQPVFILGTGRSGTTILGVSLGVHSDVGFLNEPKAAWAFAHEGEDLIGSYNVNKASYNLAEQDCTPRVKKVMRRIYSHYLLLTNSNVLVDKYPELIFRIEFVRAIFPDAKFLFLYRNGNDTVVSIDKWSERLGVVKDGETHDWWGLNDRKWHLLCDQVVALDEDLGVHINEIKAFEDHTYRAAVEWIVTMRQGLKVKEQFPNGVYSIKYEDYVSSAKVRDELLSFCGLAANSQYEDYCEAALAPAASASKAELPGCLVGAFTSTMRELGYDA